jgi:hypothetical protein
LIDNSIRWSTKIGGRWSDDPFYPVYQIIERFFDSKNAGKDHGFFTSKILLKLFEGGIIRKSLVASYQKNSFLKKGELQPPPLRNPYKFCSRLARFYKDLKIKKRLKITSCLLWLPR